MTFPRILVLASIATFAGACVSGTTDKSSDDTFDSGDTDTDTMDTDTDTMDTDTDTMDTEVLDVTPTWNTDAWTNGDWEEFFGCGTGSITLSAETNNWGYAADVYLAATRFIGSGSWDELHTLAGTDGGNNNDGSGYTVYTRTLTTGASAGSQMADMNTLWVCSGTPSIDPGAAANFQVTAALAVWGEDDDPATDAPADCIVIGDPLGVDSSTASTGPDELLANPSAGGRTPPSWLNSTNCRIVE